MPVRAQDLSRARKGCDLNSGVLLTVAIVVCVIALAALTALVLVIRRNGSPLRGTGGLSARTAPTAGTAAEAQIAPAATASSEMSAVPAAQAASDADAATDVLQTPDSPQPAAPQPAAPQPAAPQPAAPQPAAPEPAQTAPPFSGTRSPDPVAAAAAARQADQLEAQVRQLRAQAEREEAAIVARAAQAEREEAAIVARAAQAEREEAAIVARAAQADQSRREVESEIKAVKEEIRLLRADLERREVRLADREQRIHEEARKADERADALDATRQGLDQQRDELRQQDAQRREVLERLAGLTADQAKAELVTGIENQAKREAALIVRDIEGEARKEGDKRARKIITLAIQRVASEQTSESVVSVLHLPGDEMKGRIIGREGRNIRAFESVTGVNLIIDDTPEAVLLSCFDPVRREVGRLTLERLVLDGRIHPQRIEEAYERSKAEIEQLCVRAGEDALVDVGITDMDPELVNLLGRLRYRTSYGQNVLKHLIESAHIAGMMASELGLDPVLMKRGTLLHDIGKALTHEVQGSHALIGAEIARRYGESPDVVHAIEAHHNEVEVRTVEAVLTQAADAISGGRPGARRESLEAYVKRLERLEQIALAQDGVEKVFAMQAGREVRIMVKPTDVDDIQAQVIARDVAKQVEDELTYPGQIRVTVVRESRATEFAR
jgi:ribonuclease Y